MAKPRAPGHPGLDRRHRPEERGAGRRGGRRLAADPLRPGPLPAGVGRRARRPARRSGPSDLGPLQIMAGGTVALGSGPEVREAREATRANVGFYVGGMGAREKNFYNELFQRYGWVDEAREIQDLFLSGHREEAIAKVPDEYVDLATLAGDPGLRARSHRRLQGHRRHVPQHQRRRRGAAQDLRTGQGLGRVGAGTIAEEVVAAYRALAARRADHGHGRQRQRAHRAGDAHHAVGDGRRRPSSRARPVRAGPGDRARGGGDAVVGVAAPPRGVPGQRRRGRRPHPLAGGDRGVADRRRAARRALLHQPPRRTGAGRPVRDVRLRGARRRRRVGAPRPPRRHHGEPRRRDDRPRPRRRRRPGPTPRVARRALPQGGGRRRRRRALTAADLEAVRAQPARIAERGYRLG